MKRLLSASMVTGICVALSAMFVSGEQASAQVRFYAGPGGVGIGYGNGNYGNYGNYGYRGGGYGYPGGGYGYGSAYRGYGGAYGGTYINPYYGNFGNRSYGPSYSYRGNSNYYAPSYNNGNYQGNSGYYTTREIPREDTRPDRPVMGVRIRSAGEGVRVVVVQPNSPAEQAGLREGDLITTFNGKRVTTEQGLLSELDRLDPNANVQVTVRSSEGTWDTSMQLTTYGDAFLNNVAGQDGQRRTVGRPTLNNSRDNSRIPTPPPAIDSRDADLDIPAPPENIDDTPAPLDADST